MLEDISNTIIRSNQTLVARLKISLTITSRFIELIFILVGKVKERMGAFYGDFKQTI